MALVMRCGYFPLKSVLKRHGKADALLCGGWGEFHPHNKRLNIAITPHFMRTGTPRVPDCHSVHRRAVRQKMGKTCADAMSGRHGLATMTAHNRLEAD